MVASLMEGASTDCAQPERSATRAFCPAGDEASCGAKVAGPDMWLRGAARAGASDRSAASRRPVAPRCRSTGASGFAQKAAATAARNRPGYGSTKASTRLSARSAKGRR